MLGCNVYVSEGRCAQTLDALQVPHPTVARSFARAGWESRGVLRLGRVALSARRTDAHGVRAKQHSVQPAPCRARTSYGPFATPLTIGPALRWRHRVRRRCPPRWWRWWGRRSQSSTCAATRRRIRAWAWWTTCRATRWSRPAPSRPLLRYLPKPVDSGRHAPYPAVDKVRLFIAIPQARNPVSCKNPVLQQSTHRVARHTSLFIVFISSRGEHGHRSSPARPRHPSKR